MPYLTMATQLTHMSEAYNIKLIQYDNGIVEIRIYDKPINADFEETTLCQLEMADLIAEHKKVYREARKQQQLDYEYARKEYNPFTDKEEYLNNYSDIDEIILAHERSVRNSLNRTIHSIYKYSRQCDWEYFITLTFNEECVDRYDFSECMKKANKWFNNQRNRFATDLKYLFVPEQHKDGAWHIHGVICDTGSMKIEDSGRVAIGKKSYVRNESNNHYPTIYNLGGWKFGFSTATAVRDTDKVSTYITKYITKEICETSKGRKRYYRSQNIPEPTETEFFVEGNKDDFIQTLIDSLGCDLTYEKSIGGYLSVDYKYYKMNKEEREEQKTWRK